MTSGHSLIPRLARLELLLKVFQYYILSGNSREFSGISLLVIIIKFIQFESDLRAFQKNLSFFFQLKSR